MALTTSPVDSPAVDRQVQGAVAVGSWCFVVVGVGHLAILGIKNLRTPTPAVQRAIDAMDAAPVTLLGLTRDMTTLNNGFSILMALLGIGYGVLNLAVRRLAPAAFVSSGALLWINLAMAVAGLTVAVLAFPPPPIVLLSLAAAAFAWALVTRRRRS